MRQDGTCGTGSLAKNECKRFVRSPRSLAESPLTIDDAKRARHEPLDGLRERAIADALKVSCRLRGRLHTPPRLASPTHRLAKSQQIDLKSFCSRRIVGSALAYVFGASEIKSSRSERG